MKDFTKHLNEEQYRITQQHGTEAPFSGAYWDKSDVGSYNCICCDIITGNVYCFSIGYLNKYDMVAYICRRCSIDKKNIIRITNHAPNFINYL